MPHNVRSHTKYDTAQVEQVQTVLLLFLFQRGARDSANYYGQTVLDLIESEDMRRMVRVSTSARDYKVHFPHIFILFCQFD